MKSLSVAGDGSVRPTYAHLRVTIVVDAFWSHGSIFDIAMLDDLYRQLNKVTPWHEFWRIRDTRTLFDQGFYHDMPKGDLHNALADAKRQAIGVQNVNRQIRNLKK